MSRSPSRLQGKCKNCRLCFVAPAQIAAREFADCKMQLQHPPSPGQSVQDFSYTRTRFFAVIKGTLGPSFQAISCHLDIQRQLYFVLDWNCMFKLDDYIRESRPNQAWEWDPSRA